MSRHKKDPLRELTEPERQELRQLISHGKADARKLAHARILLQADELVELEVVDAVSHETVRQTLKKTSSSRT